ncbi:MAG: hypothetical protein ACJ0BL_00865 [Dehalococcoidia bacterium]
MRKFILSGLLVFPLLFIFSDFVIHAAPDDPNITEVRGLVINGTDGSEAGKDISVGLHVSKLGSSSTMINGATKSDGSFVFTDVPIEDDALYGISVLYDGVTYASGFDIYSKNPVELVIYETTNSDEIVSVVNASFLFTDVDIESQKIFVMEMVSLDNNTDMTYKPGSGPMELLRFGLPDGVDQLVVDTGLRDADWIQVDRGFALIASVPPGTHELMYSYSLPYNSSAITFSKNWRYGADNFRMVAPQGIFDFRTDLGSEVINKDIGGLIYQVQEVEGIGREQMMSVDVYNLSMPSIWQKSLRYFTTARYEYSGPIALSIILLIVGVVGIWKTMMVRRRKSGWFPGSEEKQVIGDMIAEVDILFEKGLIDKEEHFVRVESLKKRFNALS